MLYRSTYYDLHHLVIHRFRSFLTLASCDTADKRGKELQEQLPRRVLNEDCCCCFHWQMQIAYLLIPCPQQHIQSKMQETRGKAKQIKKYNACTHINEQQLRDLFKLRKSQQSDSSKLVSCLQDLRAFLELIQRVKAILIAMARIWAVAKEDLLGESLNDPEPSYFIPSNTLMVERD